jgi:hypothetical protein
MSPPAEARGYVTRLAMVGKIGDDQAFMRFAAAASAAEAGAELAGTVIGSERSASDCAAAGR